MTVITEIREELTKHAATSNIARLLSWAELHTGDQFDRICELEEELKQSNAEADNLRMALHLATGGLDVIRGYMKSENVEIAHSVFAKDFAPWTNIMSAHGMKPDGTSKKSRKDLPVKP